MRWRGQTSECATNRESSDKKRGYQDLSSDESLSCSILPLGDCDEAFDLCSLCCVCVWQSERAEACVAAIAGTFASADLAGESARSPACRGAGGR